MISLRNANPRPAKLLLDRFSGQRGPHACGTSFRPVLVFIPYLGRLDQKI
jgi:hypothetical protein